MSVIATYAYRCNVAKCDVVETREHRASIGDEMPRPTAPDGWRVFPGGIVCPAHVVSLEVDGERVAL